MSDDAPRTVADVDLVLVLPPLDIATTYFCVRIKEGETRDQLRRRLAMGERAEQAAHWLSYSLKPGSADRCDGANAMLDHIRGDQ